MEAPASRRSLGHKAFKKNGGIAMQRASKLGDGQFNIEPQREQRFSTLSERPNSIDKTEDRDIKSAAS
jgi:hypothetical protein